MNGDEAMCIMGETPVDRLMDELAARRRARQDWAYADELRKRIEEAKRPDVKIDINPWTGAPRNGPYQQTG